MFGRPQFAPQNEDTPFLPRTAYGISKLTSYHIMRHYREERGMFCVAGFLYNHESPRRRPEFVTRKITRAVARIARGGARTLELGNLDATRDWGYSPDYVNAMHLMLNHPEQRDFVVASGVSHTVREFCEAAFSHAGLDWKEHVLSAEKFFRREQGAPLVGDPSRIRTALGWRSTRSFEQIVQEMVDCDLKAGS
jgi:GDPmannose 4,6-dehydratase